MRQLQHETSGVAGRVGAGGRGTEGAEGAAVDRGDLRGSLQGDRDDPLANPAEDPATDPAEAPAEDPGPDLAAADTPSRNRRAKHDRLGRFTKGNTYQLKTGRYSKQVANALTTEQRALVAALVEREHSILADLGGSDVLSTFEKDLVARYMQLGNIADYNASRMLNQRAGVRKESREAFLSAVDRQLRIISLLGLARRSRDISLSPGQWLEQTARHEEEDNAAV
jgi:hypothetical protein